MNCRTHVLSAGCKKARLDFMTGWSITVKEMEVGVEDSGDMLHELLGSDSANVFDSLIALFAADDDDVADDILLVDM